jgi:hypothetical protein
MLPLDRVRRKGEGVDRAQDAAVTHLFARALACSESEAKCRTATGLTTTHYEIAANIWKDNAKNPALRYKATGVEDGGGGEAGGGEGEGEGGGGEGGGGEGEGGGEGGGAGVGGEGAQGARGGRSGGRGRGRGGRGRGGGAGPTTGTVATVHDRVTATTTILQLGPNGMLTGLGSMHAKRLDAAVAAHGVVSAVERSAAWLAGANEAARHDVYQRWRDALVGAQKSPTLPNFEAMCAALRRHLAGSEHENSGGTCAGGEEVPTVEAEEEGVEEELEGGAAEVVPADDSETDDQGDHDDDDDDETEDSCELGYEGSACDPDSNDWAGGLDYDEFGYSFYPEDDEEDEEEEAEGDWDAALGGSEGEQRPRDSLAPVIDPSVRLDVLEED